MLLMFFKILVKVDNILVHMTHIEKLISYSWSATQIAYVHQFSSRSIEIYIRRQIRGGGVNRISTLVLVIYYFYIRSVYRCRFGTDTFLCFTKYKISRIFKWKNLITIMWFHIWFLVQSLRLPRELERRGCEADILKF